MHPLSNTFVKMMMKLPVVFKAFVISMRRNVMCIPGGNTTQDLSFFITLGVMPSSFSYLTYKDP